MTEIKKFITYFGQMVTLFIDLNVCLFSGKKRTKDVINQIILLGMEGFPLVAIIALATGVILAFQTAYQLQRMSSEIYVASLVALSITRELGPVLTSLIIAGRSGASISAEISTMKVTEQIDALKSLATNPISYLMVPKFLALVLTLPLLVIFADVIGILGGYIVAGTKLNMSLGLYLRMSMEALVLKDILSGLLKAVVFGGIIGLTSCYEGFQSEKGATGVGKAVIKSVVRSFIFILVADAILTAFFYVLFP
jgi:phospholipid/cholesterol/gamma-HCH transport system permease protein